MSARKPGLLWRGRLPLAATLLLLIGAVIGMPGASAAPRAQKFFTATISPTAVSGNSTAQSFTVTITNCATGVANCGIPSSIAMGSAKILVPTRFSNVSFVSAEAFLTDGTTSKGAWNAAGTGWDGTYIKAASSGSNKLNPGEVLKVTFTADVSGCSTTGSPYQFTTSAYGSTEWDQSGNSQPFSIVDPPGQPTVAISGCTLTSGGPPVTDPNTNTSISGSGWTGDILISFGTNNGELNCSGFTGGTQWLANRSPVQINIDPSNATPTGDTKTFTVSFPATTGKDSSWYLYCYGSPNAWSTTTPKTYGYQGTQTIGGVLTYVGLLRDCYDAETNSVYPNNVPCVQAQTKSLDATTITITLRVPPGDPNGR